MFTYPLAVEFVHLGARTRSVRCESTVRLYIYSLTSTSYLKRDQPDAVRFRNCSPALRVGIQYRVPLPKLVTLVANDSGPDAKADMIEI